MAKNRRHLDTPFRQGILNFEVPAPISPIPGALNISAEMRGLISNILKDCPRSRFEVAARMSELTGVEITKFQLDSWTAESRDGWRFPLEYAPAFEVACETHRITEWLAAKRGCKIMVGKEALLAELGKIEQMEAELKAQKQALKKYLAGGQG